MLLIILISILISISFIFTGIAVWFGFCIDKLNGDLSNWNIKNYKIFLAIIFFALVPFFGIYFCYVMYKHKKDTEQKLKEDIMNKLMGDEDSGAWHDYF